MFSQNITLSSDVLLSYAANGDSEMVERLIKQGVEVNSKRKGSQGFTPLLHASSNGHLEVVKLLLANGAEIDAKENTVGWTPLMYASKYGHLEVVKLLLAKGADKKIKDLNGKTALDIAKMDNRKRVILLLE